MPTLTTSMERNNMSLREILDTHPAPNLVKLIKDSNITGFAKLKKAELLDLMTSKQYAKRFHQVEPYRSGKGGKGVVRSRAQGQRKRRIKEEPRETKITEKVKKSSKKPEKKVKEDEKLQETAKKIQVFATDADQDDLYENILNVPQGEKPTVLKLAEQGRLEEVMANQQLKAQQLQQRRERAIEVQRKKDIDIKPKRPFLKKQFLDAHKAYLESKLLKDGDISNLIPQAQFLKTFQDKTGYDLFELMIMRSALNGSLFIADNGDISFVNAETGELVKYKYPQDRTQPQDDPNFVEIQRPPPLQPKPPPPPPRTALIESLPREPATPPQEAREDTPSPPLDPSNPYAQPQVLQPPTDILGTPTQDLPQVADSPPPQPAEAPAQAVVAPETPQAEDDLKRDSVIDGEEVFKKDADFIAGQSIDDPLFLEITVIQKSDFDREERKDRPIMERPDLMVKFFKTDADIIAESKMRAKGKELVFEDRQGYIPRDVKILGDFTEDFKKNNTLLEYKCNNGRFKDEDAFTDIPRYIDLGLPKILYNVSKVNGEFVHNIFPFGALQILASNDRGKIALKKDSSYLGKFFQNNGRYIGGDLGDDITPYKPQGNGKPSFGFQRSSPIYTEYLGILIAFPCIPLISSLPYDKKGGDYPVRNYPNDLSNLDYLEKYAFRDGFFTGYAFGAKRSQFKSFSDLILFLHTNPELIDKVGGITIGKKKNGDKIYSLRKGTIPKPSPKGERSMFVGALQYQTPIRMLKKFDAYNKRFVSAHGGFENMIRMCYTSDFDGDIEKGDTVVERGRGLSRMFVFNNEYLWNFADKIYDLGIRTMVSISDMNEMTDDKLMRDNLVEFEFDYYKLSGGKLRNDRAKLAYDIPEFNRIAGFNYYRKFIKKMNHFNNPYHTDRWNAGENVGRRDPNLTDIYGD